MLFVVLLLLPENMTAPQKSDWLLYVILRNSKKGFWLTLYLKELTIYDWRYPNVPKSQLKNLEKNMTKNISKIY